MKNDSHSSLGFTLIEMIMVITITGILAAIVAVFIQAPVQGYVDSVRRAELTDQADVALRRMVRDVRLSLPNSLRVVTSNQSFEFIMTKSGGRYRTDGDGSAAGDVLQFNNAADLSFDVLGLMPAMSTNDLVVIYNLGEGYTGTDAYAGSNVARIFSLSGNTVTLVTNPFTLPSPSSRFQVVDQNAQVVRYACDGAGLVRSTQCSLSATGCTAASALLAGGSGTTTSCVIDYATAATGRNGLLYISLTLSSGGESVTLFNQIHIDNTP